MPASEAGSHASGASSASSRLKWHKKFAYQRFQGWRPILNVASAQIFFLSAGVFCIALGIPILTASLTVTEYTVRYDNAGQFAGTSDRDTGGQRQQQLLWSASAADPADGFVPVTVTFNVDRDMDPPIYLFYRLGSFFQNYRRYVRSFDSTAMHDGSSGAGAAACEPFRYQTADDSPDPSQPYGGRVLPCGQIAYSNFNDSFSLAVSAPGAAPDAAFGIDSSNIAWESDAKHLYGDVNASNYNTEEFAGLRGGATTDLPLDQSQHWMVWMKPGGPTAVSKLYGVINQRIPAGSNVTVTIQNRYNTYEFGGSKSVLLTTNSWVGGRNNFLGAAYITVGGLCFLTALAFFLAYNAGLVEKRQYGDLSQLSWLKKYDGSIRPDSSRSRVQAVAMAAQNGDGQPDASTQPRKN